MRPGVLALLVAMLVVLAAPPGRAQISPAGPAALPAARIKLHLEYLRGPGTRCPDEHVVANMLQGEVLYREDAGAELRLVVEATRQGRDHRVFTVMRDGTGAALWTRTYQSPTCADALESTMVSTALELTGAEVEREARQRAALPPPAPVVPAPIVVTPPVPVVPALPPPPAERSRPPFELLAGVDALLVLGATPGPSLGAGVFMAVRPAGLPDFSVEVTGRWTGMVTAVRAGSVSVRSTFYTAQLALCRHAGFASLCPIVGIGELKHRAGNDMTQIDLRGLFGLVGARLGAEHRVGRYHLRGFVELDWLSGANFTYHNREQWGASVGGIAGLGLAL